MTGKPSDESLMLRYRDGDLHAFGELYRRHSAGLYQFIAWRSPRREWVDEIVQDSWANLHQARARYQPDARFKTYLFQIARNRLVDVLRQHGRTVLASELGLHAGDDIPLFDVLVDAACESEMPEQALARKRQVDALHRAIRTLPGEQREALILQQFNDMSLTEIAELACAPVETIKSRLRYAIRKLRVQLARSAAQPELADSACRVMETA